MMTAQEKEWRLQILEAVQRAVNKPKTKEESRASLIKAGILDNDGKISENYPHWRRYVEEQQAEK